MPIIDNGLPEIPTPTAEQMASWETWVSERPTQVRDLCERFPPWHYYDMPETGQIAVIEAWNEDGTMRVTIVGDQISIPTIVPFQVFGVAPDNLICRS